MEEVEEVRQSVGAAYVFVVSAFGRTSSGSIKELFAEVYVRGWLSTAVSFIVAFAIVAALQAQDRRTAVTPVAGGTGTAQMYSQLMHVRFTSPVVAPAGPPGGESEVRARLLNPVLGRGATQQTVLIPADVDVNIQVRLGAGNAARTNATLYLRIVSANVDPAEGRRRFASGEVRHEYVGWPKADEVLIPQNATLSFPLYGIAPDSSTAAGDANYPSHPILQQSALRAALIDQPIDVTNAGSNKLFRAQLTEDMEYTGGPSAPMPAGAIKLPKGTEVWVRSYEPDPEAQLGHGANMSIDFVVINGKRINIRTVPERRPFTPGAMAFSPDGKGRVPEALWPTNQPRRFVLSEQQEVSDNGSTLWTYPENPNKAEEYRLAPGSPPPVVPQGTPPSPPQPGRPNTTSADEARKRAEALRACQLRAITEHPRGGLEQAQALAACSQAK